MKRFRWIMILPLLICAAVCPLRGQTMRQYLPEGRNAHTRTLTPVNASDMEFMKSGTEYGIVSVGADACGGKLHEARQADRVTGLNFDAAGESQAGIFHLNGSFSFRQSFENGITHASTFHPTRPMPYVIADSTGGDWRKQDYRMCVDISMPVFRDVLSLGLAMGLEAGRGAKKTDPRPQAGLCSIDVSPSISLNAGSAGVLSAGFICNMYRETSNLILYDSSQPQKLYLLKGLGQYVYEVFSSSERERKYEGGKIGAKAGWTICPGDFSLSIDGRYRNGMERVFDVDYSKPHDRGAFITHEFDAGLRSRVEKTSWGAGFDLGWNGFFGSGRELVQHFSASSDVNSWVTDSENPARYLRNENEVSALLQAWLKNASGSETWNFCASVSIGSLSEEYRATESLMDRNVLAVSPSLGRRFALPSSVLSLKMGGEFSRLLSSELRYSVREEDDMNISHGLVYHDFFLPQNRAGVLAGAGCLWFLKDGRSLSLDFRGVLRSALSIDGVEDARNIFRDSAPASFRRWSASLSLTYSF